MKYHNFDQLSKKKQSKDCHSRKIVEKERKRRELICEKDMKIK
jgi:hypothetical protein